MQAIPQILSSKYGVVIGITRTRILGMILDAHRHGRLLTIRDLCRRLGAQPNGVHNHLHALRDQGLVAWEEGQCRTLRPTCRYVPASELAAHDDRPTGRMSS